MTKEEAYKIFVREITDNDANLIELVNNNVMLPVAFNSAWAMASNNQKIKDIDKACEWIRRQHCDIVCGSMKNWENDFRKAMEGIV